MNENDEVVRAFLDELDRRIDSPESEQPEDSKELLRKIRPALKLLLLNSPNAPETLRRVMREFGVLRD